VPGVGRTEKAPLQRRHGTVNGPFAPAWHPAESIFGSTAKGYSIERRQRTGKTGD
jgi:hypothetical protein